MKLPFDQMLSFNLVERVQERFPGSSHTELLGLGSADDANVWSFAARNGL